MIKSKIVVLTMALVLFGALFVPVAVAKTYDSSKYVKVDLPSASSGIKVANDVSFSNVQEATKRLAAIGTMLGIPILPATINGTFKLAEKAAGMYNVSKEDVYMDIYTKGHPTRDLQIEVDYVYMKIEDYNRMVNRLQTNPLYYI